ncbi:MAG: AIR synthase-related protein, partial [Actinomycetota bacterium]|nr:AIR synthase-related protein [Actinomycetota bacterium]
HDHLGGRPPVVDLAAERLLACTVLSATSAGLVHSAHDLSQGGLAVALAEGVLRHGVGVTVSLAALCAADGVDEFVALFSESAGRAIVAVPRSEEMRFTDMATARSVPHVRLGVVDAGDGDPVLDVQGQFSVPLVELRAAWSGTIPDAISA